MSEIKGDDYGKRVVGTRGGYSEYPVKYRGRNEYMGGDKMERGNNLEGKDGEKYFAVEAEKLRFEKDRLRAELFRKVQDLLNNQKDDYGGHPQMFIGDGKSVAGKIGALSQVDEFLFCDEVFRVIYKKCFGDLDDGEKKSQHIMVRVLGGESIDLNLEGRRVFIYDDRDVLAERLLKILIAENDMEGLLDKLEKIRSEQADLQVGVSVKGGNRVSSLGLTRDLPVQ